MKKSQAATEPQLTAYVPLHLEADEPGHDNEDLQSLDTSSLTPSILEYRTINGRTYHSARFAIDYFTPNDGQHQEVLDVAHRYLEVLLDGRLFLAPIPEDVKAVLDIGTGTGIWAIEFADTYPDAEVIGTDLSPMQPPWVPANLRFEIDDATQPWTWNEGYFDFVHMRCLFGAISNWKALFEQAYRCCKPGGWVQSTEIDAPIHCDDGTLDAHPAIMKWAEMYREAGRKTGRSFNIIAEDLQRAGMQAAGFIDIKVVDIKLPMGGWARNPKLKEAGYLARLALETDIEGYTQLVWHKILEWPQSEYHPFISDMKRFVCDRGAHGYVRVRYVYGRKPLAA